MTKDKIEIYPKKRKLIKLTVIGISLILICAITSFISLSEVSQDNKYIPIFFFFFSLCGIFMFGMAILFYLKRLKYPAPSIILNKEGIYDNSSAFKTGMIKWEEINRMYIYDIKKNRFLGLEINNFDQFVSKQNRFMKLLIKINQKFYRTPITIPESMLSIRLEELIELIIHFEKPSGIKVQEYEM
ncbi:STM3941 family protein [Chengkuizengella sediminis]|uniref:STM3941 family protein n=1 Tax=Chengkuizengella sediminis TaxID=1885917 RepID=UPI001389FDE6|nr:STM3941 family protein [Chengkuizengella sediminis]NDI33233.1 hypothetical protein [Chengkuizengella sediminis]